ncbi:DUF5110 domain-containing protein [Sphingomonas panacisoli]|uniref:glycoside hydrolase family 31 protein n=1 Tax=Sphingomonas panacisoli TaxID=1813879 RepID=UPI001F00498A|nr:DUF5110 domain-containing protein [Sphingomonas panacisoli]
MHGPAQEAIRRRYIEERYRLMPYIYGLAEENSRTGLPLMRPVFLEYPKVVKGDRVGGTEDQFMLGRDLLIAPPMTWESPAAYDIALPGVGWYDYWTGARIDAAKTVETPKLDRLPVFVRPGAIIPKQPLVQSTGETPKGALEINVYPGGDDCAGSLYLDAGDGYGYQRGQFLRQAIRCDAGSVTFDPRAGACKPWWTGFDVVIHGWKSAAPKVMLGTKKIVVRIEDGALRFSLPDLPKGARVAIEP